MLPAYGFSILFFVLMTLHFVLCHYFSSSFHDHIVKSIVIHQFNYWKSPLSHTTASLSPNIKLPINPHCFLLHTGLFSLPILPWDVFLLPSAVIRNSNSFSVFSARGTAPSTLFYAVKQNLFLPKNDPATFQPNFQPGATQRGVQSSGGFQSSLP